MMKTLVSMILIVLSCNFLHLHVLNCADAHCLQNCNKMCLSLKDAVRPHPHHKARGKVEYVTVTMVLHLGSSNTTTIIFHIIITI